MGIAMHVRCVSTDPRKGSSLITIGEPSLFSNLHTTLLLGPLPLPDNTFRLHETSDVCVSITHVLEVGPFTRQYVSLDFVAVCKEWDDRG